VDNEDMSESSYVFVRNLGAEVETPSKGILSHTLHEDVWHKIVLFAFSDGHSISPHAVPVPATVYFAAGRATMLLGEDRREVSAGTLIQMPPNLLHAIDAHEGVKMLLILQKAR
jgi:quercetin dioxygenase-like cupin family protein